MREAIAGQHLPESMHHLAIPVKVGKTHLGDCKWAHSVPTRRKHGETVHD
jgi:hypothetical protein